MRLSGLLPLFALCGLLAADAASAHHGTSAYDMTIEIALKGTVRDWSFESPHSWLWLRVTGPGGASEEWSIESAPPGFLARQGWSAGTLAPGETLTALISPLRGEPRRGILLEVSRDSGETLVVRPRGSFGRPR